MDGSARPFYSRGMTSIVEPRLSRHLLAAAALGAALFSFQTRASAQDDVASPDRFGSKGQFAITAEDLTGVYSDHIGYTDQNGNDNSLTTTRFSLLFSTHGGGNNIVTSPASTLGLHYFVIDGLSVGGNIGYESRSGSVQSVQGGRTFSQDLGSGSTFIFEPKVGYALMLNDLLGFWFRGGLSVAVDSEHPDAADTPIEDKFTYWLFSADVLFCIMPVDHFGFYVGPGIDISFTGSYKRTRRVGGALQTLSFDSSYRRIKLGAGMIAYF